MSVKPKVDYRFVGIGALCLLLGQGCSSGDKQAKAHTDSLSVLKAKSDSLASTLLARDSADAKRTADSLAVAKRVADSVAAERMKPRELSVLSTTGISIPAQGLDVHHFELVGAGTCTLSGRIEVTEGGTKDAQILVLTDDQFVNWRNNASGSGAAAFRSPAQTITNLNVALPSPGRYRLVLSNRQAILLTRRLQGQATVTCIGGSEPRALE